MAIHGPDPEFDGPGPASPNELRRWIEELRRLPPARREKVLAAREALHRQAYERDCVLDETVARLAAELGIEPRSSERDR